MIVCKFHVQGRSTFVLILFARPLIRHRNGLSRRSRIGFASCIVIIVNTFRIPGQIIVKYLAKKRIESVSKKRGFGRPSQSCRTARGARAQPLAKK